MSITHNCTRVSHEINTHCGDTSVWVRILCASPEGLERESLPVCQIRQVYLKGFSQGQEARLFPEPTFSQSPTSIGTGCPLASSGEFGLDIHAGLLWACLLSFWAGLTPSMTLCFLDLPCCGAPLLYLVHIVGVQPRIWILLLTLATCPMLFCLVRYSVLAPAWPTCCLTKNILLASGPVTPTSITHWKERTPQNHTPHLAFDDTEGGWLLSMIGSCLISSTFSIKESFAVLEVEKTQCKCCPTIQLCW